MVPRLLLIALLVLGFPALILAQFIVIGNLDPDEQVVWGGETITCDSLLIMNQASLTVLGSNVLVRETLIVLHEASLSVSNSDFAVHGQLVLADGPAQAEFRDSVTLQCDIFAAGDSELLIDEATVDASMLYQRQYGLYGFEAGSIRFDTATFDLGDGAWGGTFTDQASLTIDTSTMQSTQMPLTLGLLGQATVAVNGLPTGIELVLGDSVAVDLDDVTFPVVWYSPSHGAAIDHEFPDPTLGYASDVDTYTFSGDLPGVAGVDFSLSMNECELAYWALLLGEGVDVSIHNSMLAAVGFTASDGAALAFNALVNDSLYTAYDDPLPDRDFSLTNTAVQAWNLYAYAGSTIEITNSLYGESWTFDDGELLVRDSICDGTGGSVTLNGTGRAWFENCELYRAGDPSIQILKVVENARGWFVNGEISSASVVSDRGALHLNGTGAYPPTLLDRATCYRGQFVGWPDSLNIWNGGYELDAELTALAGPDTTTAFDGYLFTFEPEDGGPVEILGESDEPFTSLSGAVGAHDFMVPEGSYRFTLTAWADGDTALVLRRTLLIYPESAVEDRDDPLPHQFALHGAYPNPFNTSATVEFTLDRPESATLELLNLLGRHAATLVHDDFRPGRHTVALDASRLASGSYLLRLRTDSRHATTRVTVLR